MPNWGTKFRLVYKTVKTQTVLVAKSKNGPKDESRVESLLFSETHCDSLKLYGSLQNKELFQHL